MIESVKALLFSEAFTARCRTQKKFFTRQRILTFPVLVGCLLNMLTKSLQIEWDRFLKVLKQGVEALTVTKQAFGQARKKFSEEAFILLNERLVEEFYTEKTYQTWKGYRVLGIDGSTAQLPMGPEILRTFGGVSNQHGLVMAMGRISAMYDVLNELSVDAVLAPYCTGERELALGHVDALVGFDERTEGHRGHQQDLLLFDMGYPALWFMAYLIVMGKAFVIRTSAAFLKEVQDAIQAPQPDIVIQIPLQKPGRPLPKELKALVPDIDPTMVLSIRVLTLELEDGTPEFLLTPLLDTGRFPYEDFQGLYATRWGSETNDDVLKNILEIEDFTGKSALSVRQDFYATVLTNNIRGVIHWDLQEEVAKENRSKARKYTYQLNRNLSIGRLKDRIVTLILNQGDVQAFYEDLKREMKRTMVPIRPGRHFPRTRKNRQKYSITKKRAL